MDFFEKKLSGETVYSGKILNLEVDEVELSDGFKTKREVIRHLCGAAVLCVKDGKVLLVKQFRYPYGRELYEIPAGKLNPGESPLKGAEREFEEETGYTAELSRFARIYPSPGYTDEIIYIFIAENLTRSRQNLDKGEFLTAEFIPLKRVAEMVESGEICDAKTVVAIYKYLALNRKNQ